MRISNILSLQSNLLPQKTASRPLYRDKNLSESLQLFLRESQRGFEMKLNRFARFFDTTMQRCGDTLQKLCVM